MRDAHLVLSVAGIVIGGSCFLSRCCLIITHNFYFVICNQVIFLIHLGKVVKTDYNSLQIDFFSSMSYTEIKDNEATVCGEWRVAVE